MKRWILILILFGITYITNAQETIIAGKIENTTSDRLIIETFFEDFKDTIKINSDGSFKYNTRKIKLPLTVKLHTDRLTFYAFLAPGYDLKINANGLNYNTFINSLSYSGLGSKSNAYWKDVIQAIGTDTVNWMNKDSESYLKHLLEKRSIDSLIIAKHFNALNKEPYSNYYKKARLNQSRFEPLVALLDRYGLQNRLKWSQLQDMLAKLGMKSFQNELNNAANMNSESFCILAYRYPTLCYFYKLIPLDTSQENLDSYLNRLYKQFYTGKVYNFIIYDDVRLRLSAAVKESDLKQLEDSANSIEDLDLKTALFARISERKREILLIRTGSPAPNFNLPDTSGKKFQLSDFRGKVLYIDFWASWCGPCKAETPYLKAIDEHYKNDNRLQIISIATWDAANRSKRYEIIKQDQMDWLQLEDTKDSLAKAYNIKGIPHFIIIDKQGRVVDVFADRPSSQQKLIAVLDKLISNDQK